jgi:tRNA dimethylallyltransferase
MIYPAVNNQSSAMRLPRIVCILGVTGAGKSSLALKLAEKYDIAVVNFDSRQVYAELPIITDQPGPEEQSLCPHYLYGFLSADAAMDAGKFITQARQALDRAAAAGRLPVLVGGTGFYLRALIHGLAPIPEIPEDVRTQVRLQCSELGPGFLHARLSRIDPQSAQRIHPNDWQRVCRALEVYMGTGKKLSAWHEIDPEHPGFSALKLGLAPHERSLLKDSLHSRIQDMLDKGAVQEVKNVLEKYGEDAPGLTGIGAPELVGYIQGKTTLEETKQLWLKNTFAYAKRQLTWFKKEKDVIWLNTSSAVEETEQAIDSFLAP